MADDRIKKPTIRKIYTPERKEEKKAKKFRVAAYCRVSTNLSEQLTSYETQVAVYTQKIAAEPEWVLAGIYADRGLSGTQAVRRPEFLRMIRDCDDGKIDVILCKSLSRFSRNTLDAISYIRHLKELGVRIIFEKEEIDTDSDYCEMLLTVLAAFAQEESRSISENLKRGMRMRMKLGHDRWVRVYGYEKTEEGTYQVVPEEAAVIRRIFDEYERGVSTKEIVRRLEADGIPSMKGMHWEDTRVFDIIKNEKYVGDVRMQKKFTADHLTHKQVKNNGEVPQYYSRDHHVPIVERAQFDRCNVIIRLKNRPYEDRKAYPYADFVKCPYCGRHLIRHKTAIQYREDCFCCEGDGACREFVIVAAPVIEAILKAYRTVDMDKVRRAAEAKLRWKADAARLFLTTRERYPEMDSVEYWWLDDLVRSITFGKHTYTQTELMEMPEDVRKTVDDRTVTVHWKCGVNTTLPSGVSRDSQHPRHKAELWDAYLLRHPDKYPDYTADVLRKQGNT